MSENEAPDGTPKEAPSSPPSPSTPAPASPAAESKLDWRLVAIIGVAVLFLVAAYVNRKYYGKKKVESPQAVSGQPGAGGTGSRPTAPPLSPSEQYAMLTTQCETEARNAMFSLDSRTTILAVPPIAEAAAPGKSVPVIRLGRMFDVTKLAEGVKPEMFHRRGLFDANNTMVFMNTFTPLGLPKSPDMVIRPAAEVKMDVVGDAQGVIGVAVGDEARAYPLKLMNYHEVINDALGGAPILVTWSALADAGIAMLRTRPDGKVGLFGSAGLIYQSAIMMYDLDTMSLWSSTEHRCVAGDSCGIGLEPVQATITNWQAWKSRHPNTTVLVGTNPVLPLNYEANPAVPRDYLNDPRILYPVYGLDVARTPVRLKSLVFGVAGPDGKSVRAYDVGLLIQSSGPFEDALGGLKVTCEYTREGNIFSVKSADGKPLLTEMMFWMAWAGAHPNTEVWQEGKLRAAMNPAPSVPMAPTAPSAAGPAVTPAGTLK